MAGACLSHYRLASTAGCRYQAPPNFATLHQVPAYRFPHIASCMVFSTRLLHQHPPGCCVSLPAYHFLHNVSIRLHQAPPTFAKLHQALAYRFLYIASCIVLSTRLIQAPPASTRFLRIASCTSLPTYCFPPGSTRLQQAHAHSTIHQAPPCFTKLHQVPVHRFLHLAPCVAFSNMLYQAPAGSTSQGR